MDETALRRIQELESENRELKKRLSKYEYMDIQAKPLSKDEKLSIYMNYFKGREDAVAIRYFNKGKQRFQYTPFCSHEFEKGICLKSKEKRINCVLCPNRNFIPYTREVLLEHFTSKEHHKIYNKDVCLGIYPLLKDTTCNFIAIDFDDGGWLEEMLCVYHIAQRYKISPLLERSQSGAGGHLWIFFDTAISAVKARKLGFFLLKIAMHENKNIHLNSFDRMFPNQDYTAKEGLGNLIALPLYAEAFKKGNSAFINELGQVIKNQIGYLSMIPKLCENEVNKILQFDEGDNYFFDEAQMSLSLQVDTKYSKKLDVIETSMLHIKKQDCNTLTINIIRRIASMINPEYYLKMRLHKPIFDTPYILSEYVENDHYISIPRGCKDKLMKVFVNAELNIRDQRCEGHTIEVQFKGTLKEMQKEPVQSLLRNDMGVLHASAGFGKTVMALYAIAHRKCSTLIIVTSKGLKNQWLERIHQFLDIPKEIKKKNAYVGEYTGSKKNLKGNLDIATIQSLAKSENLDSLLSPYGMIIVDECHHIPSQSFRTVLRKAKMKWIYGFSATPDRQDGLEKIVYMYCGEKRFETNKKLIISHREFSQYLIPHFTNIRILDKKETYQEIIDDIYRNEHRNFMIANDIITEFRNGRTCIVLSERVEHLHILYEKIRDVSCNVFILTSDMKVSKRKQVDEEIKQLEGQEKYIILATSKLLGEGFDNPSLDTLFLTLPISDKNRIAQYTGRIHRETAGKSAVYVHDYVDIHIPMMAAMFQKRLFAYQTEGYITKENQRTHKSIRYVFDSSNYLGSLHEDFKYVKRKVVIAVTDIQLNKVKQHFKILQDASMRGIKIVFTIYDNIVDNEVIKYIQGCGATLQTRKWNRTSNFIIFDDELIWYGSLNPFMHNKKDVTFIRLENKMLVEEMMEGFIEQEKEIEDSLFLVREV